MSDLSIFASPLEHHTLECLVFQWTVNKDRTMRFIADAEKSLPMHGGRITSAHERGQAVVQGDGASYRHVDLTIRRDADGEEWEVRLKEYDWLVIWLHHERINYVQVVDPQFGETLFRPMAPIVQIRREVPQIGAPEVAD